MVELNLEFVDVLFSIFWLRLQTAKFCSQPQIYWAPNVLLLAMKELSLQNVYDTNKFLWHTYHMTIFQVSF